MSEATSGTFSVPLAPSRTAEQSVELVPNADEIDVAEAVVEDRHAAKVSPKDQSLKLQRPRMLNKGRVIGVVICATSIGAGALVLGFIPQQGKAPGGASAEEASTQLPPSGDNLAVPDVLQNAPDNASPLPVATPPADKSVFASTLGAAGTEPGTGAGGAPNLGALNRTATSTAGPPGPSPERQARREQLERARSGPITFDIQIPGLDEKQTPGGGDARLAPAMGGALVGTGAGASPPMPGPVAGGEPDPNRQGEKIAFLQQNNRGGSAYVADRLAYPVSPYELKAGSIIPVSLITGINSDLPGEVIGQVRENVYDTVTGDHLLVPQGSRLLARLDSSVAYGQERVLLCWSRLIRPDGSSIGLECAPGVDLAGQSGFADQVDNHWGRLITGVVLSSLLSATTQAAVGTGGGVQPSLPQLWASGAATEINAVGQQFTKKNLAVQPTIKIRPGFGVNVLVNKDLILAPSTPRR